ncbi:OsmC family protein [Gryllotalpicola sp.]|uniref:OsmC family protein n=1 Tax=Gryllotalpicola sp. TaxID=1932787 RepID=UPI0026148A8E|nr:OsmC family protein [Gryllotalpicola sp.]
MNLSHRYQVSLEWTGDRGTGTSAYRAYGRDHTVRAVGKDDILGSADPAFFGAASRWNPEEMLLAALAQCHLLSYLHVAVLRGVRVVGYTDDALGTMALDENGGGRFTEAVLRPRVVVADAAMIETAIAIHHEAHEKCFIASSVNFPVRTEPVAVAR